MCQCSHFCITSASSPSLISLSKNTKKPCFLDYPPDIGKLAIACQTEGLFYLEGGAADSGQDSFLPESHRLRHHQLLAVVDLLIDAATETHWKSPGTGPMTWTYALFFMHVVVPKCTPPPIVTSNITEIILCHVLKTKNL